MTGWTTIRTELLDAAPWNYKEGDAFRSQQLRENLRRNGLIVNLVVREMPGGRYEVCDGNHRLDEVRALGHETVMCYNLGEISQAKAARVAVEVNETRFPTDYVDLGKLVSEMVEDDPEVSRTLPFDDKTMKDLLEIGHFDWEGWDESFEAIDVDEAMLNLGVKVHLTRRGFEALKVLRLAWAEKHGPTSDDVLVTEAVLSLCRALGQDVPETPAEPPQAVSGPEGQATEEADSEAGHE